jgi:hypothetical protein
VEDMPTVEISERTMKKLKAFAKVIDQVIGEELGGDSEYAEFVLNIGMEKMLQDIIPPHMAVEESWFKEHPDAKVLRDTIIVMFRINPEFVSEIIADILREGEIVRKEETERTRKKWQTYIV